MAYDQIIYNQSIYNNYSGQTQSDSLHIDAFETVICICKASETINLGVSFTETFSCTSHISIGKKLVITASETVISESNMYSLSEISAEGQEIISSYSDISTSLNLLINAYENLTGNINFGYVISFHKELYESFSGEFITTKIIEISTELYEIIDCTAEAENTEIYILTVDVSISPGGKLIIDSENYVAYLDGQNVLDKVSGEWLDELSDDTISVSVNCGNSRSLRTSMLYKELFL